MKDTETRQPIRYRSTADIGAWFGVGAQTVIKWRNRYRNEKHPFPREDAIIGMVPGWLPERETEIREWERHRPGPGGRKDLGDVINNEC